MKRFNQRFTHKLREDSWFITSVVSCRTSRREKKQSKRGLVLMELMVLFKGNLGLFFGERNIPRHDLETKYEMGNLKGSVRGSIDL